MRAIEISEKYFFEYGLPMLKSDFPELLDRIAAGVCGQGSENFGFDDETSRDHDIDPGFFLWLSADDYKKYEFRLSRAYDRLPEEFEGLKVIGKSVYGTSRHGVRETKGFFSSLTGFDGAPQTNVQWLSASENGLACAVNGRIFYDGSGEVTKLREALCAVPEDVRLKKLSRALVFAAQSGQYNYSRALAHGEKGAAVLALGEFVQNVCEAVYILNGCYCPFYKWMLAGARELPVLGGAVTLSEKLLVSPLAEKNGEIIEDISARIIAELKNRGLTDHPSDFLEPHAYEVVGRISDPELKNMHIME